MFFLLSVLSLRLATKLSYRESTNTLNRFRRQSQGGTPSRTLADTAEKEGTKLQQHQDKMTEEILKEHEFNEDGTPQNNEDKGYGISKTEASISKDKVTEALENYNKDIENDNKK